MQLSGRKFHKGLHSHEYMNTIKLIWFFSFSPADRTAIYISEADIVSEMSLLLHPDGNSAWLAKCLIHKCIQPLVFKVGIINSTFQLKLCLNDEVSPKWNQWEVCVNIWGFILTYRGILIKTDNQIKESSN